MLKLVTRWYILVGCACIGALSMQQSVNEQNFLIIYIIINFKRSLMYHHIIEEYAVTICMHAYRVMLHNH